MFGDSVVIWGTFSRDEFGNFLEEFTKEYPGLEVVTYVRKDETTFDNELVNALAEGNSPDLILVGAESIVKHRSKLQPIPYETLPVRDFKDSYLDAADVFLLSDGVYGLPLAIDPLILYWNRDLFTSNGIAQPPTTWESLVVNVVPVLTDRDNRRTILKSAVAFGEYQNVKNVNAILLMLLLQSGSAMVTEDGGKYTVGLNTDVSTPTKRPLASVVQFYTDFSNSNSPLYSWNRSLALDQDAFIAGDLATYFGFGSEVKRVAEKNPNLNFDVAVVPQGTGASVRRTYAKVLGFAIPRGAKNKQGAFGVARVLTGAKPSIAFSDRFNLTPVHRASHSRTDLNQYQRVSYESALFARDWLNPDPVLTDDVFSIMIEDVVSSRARSARAADDAVDRLELGLKD